MTEQERRALFHKATGKVSAHAHFEYSMFCKGMDVEREACAKVCDIVSDQAAQEQSFWGIAAAENCADAIRARGQS